MKRLLFVFMIIVVLAVIGLYAFFEFSVPEITYVADSEMQTAGNEMVIRRLYTSGVDIDAFYNQLEKTLISAEFSDEEIMAAALASGKPEFYPAFYFNIYRPDVTVNKFGFTGIIRQEMAASQTTANFKATNVFLEISTQGLTISDVDVTYNSTKPDKTSVPVISEDQTTMAISLEDATSISYSLSGNSGLVTMQYTYDVSTNNIFPSKVLEGQLLMVYAEISYSADSGLIVNYIPEPYSSLEDLEGE